MQTSEPPATVPSDLESPRAKLVYLSIATAEEPTVSELQEMLDIPKLSLLSVVGLLAARDHVERTEGGFVSVAG